MKMGCKILIGEKQTGELFGVPKIDSYHVKGLKKAIADRRNPEYELYVFYAETSELELYFDEYISRYYNEKNRDMTIVGVHYKPLERFCYQVNSIRPLHITQSLKACIVNERAARERNDDDWLKEISEEKIELYKEAVDKFNLNMKQVNDFLWGEYKHDITDCKFLNIDFSKINVELDDEDFEDDFEGFDEDDDYWEDYGSRAQEDMSDIHRNQY